MFRSLGTGRNGIARALAAFALLAFAVRALVPGGYMVGPGEAGRYLAITVCQSDATVAIDLKTGALVDPHKQKSDQGQQHAPCAFAAAPHLSTPALAALPAAPLRVALAAPQRAAALAPGRGLAAPPPWATGPPRLV